MIVFVYTWLVRSTHHIRCIYIPPNDNHRIEITPTDNLPPMKKKYPHRIPQRIGAQSPASQSLIILTILPLQWGLERPERRLMILRWGTQRPASQSLIILWSQSGQGLIILWSQSGQVQNGQVKVARGVILKISSSSSLSRFSSYSISSPSKKQPP